MKNDLEIKFTGWAFIGSAVLLIGGWLLLHHHIGQYIEGSDFAKINENLWFWIWMYRTHIFGWIGMTIALFSFLTKVSKEPFGSIIVSGGGVVISGTFIIAIATAFYYGLGAWGIGQTEGLNEEETQTFVDSLLPLNHYVTCFMRFGRVFSGAGLLIMGIVMVKWNLLNKVVNWFTAILGLTILCVILFIPDCYESYKPIFYIKVVWLLAMGGSILKNGLNLNQTKNQ